MQAALAPPLLYKVYIMSDYVRPFEFKGNTVNLAVTGSTQQLTFPAGVGTRSIRVVNVGSQTIFINKGDSTVTASTSTSLPILANTVESFLIHPEDTTLAAIAAGAGSTLYITIGEGS